MGSKLLRPEQVCLQVIDVQESLMAKIHRRTELEQTVKLMVNCARILQLPMVANTQYRKGLGLYTEILEEVCSGIPRFDKVEFNAVENRETEAFLSALPSTVSTVALVGVETHICIYQTAMGLLDKGFDVWIVNDGVSSRNLSDHQAGLVRLGQCGARQGPAEMLIYELLGKAGTAQFKAVLPHIIARQ